MKKIELQLTAKQLNTLVYAFSFLNRIYPKTRDEKVLRSLLIEMSVKIEKKHIDVKTKVASLFTKPVKAKFTLKYHEADALEKFLLIVSKEALNEYDQNAIVYINGKINQQLA